MDIPYGKKYRFHFSSSVTLRTAGFNTIPISSFQSYTIYGMALFMFIGGSPGSTAGGLKDHHFGYLISFYFEYNSR